MSSKGQIYPIVGKKGSIISNWGATCQHVLKYGQYTLFWKITTTLDEGMIYNINLHKQIDTQIYNTCQTFLSSWIVIQKRENFSNYRTHLYSQALSMSFLISFFFFYHLFQREWKKIYRPYITKYLNFSA